VDSNGYHLTGRGPEWVRRLAADNGDSIFFGPDGDADRGDRHSQRAEQRRAAANRKDTPMTRPTPTTGKPGDTTKQLKQLVGLIRTAFTGDVAVDPLDKDAPLGTQHRRIAAYNALHDLAKPGRDRFCGTRTSAMTGPCVLRDDHKPSEFDDVASHMDAEQRERALRYLVHSDPDPAKRA